MIHEEFQFSGTPHKLSLQPSGLTWSPRDHSNQEKNHISAAELLSCWSCPIGSPTCCPSYGVPSKVSNSPNHGITNTAVISSDLPSGRSHNANQNNGPFTDDRLIQDNYDIDPQNYGNSNQRISSDLSSGRSANPEHNNESFTDTTRISSNLSSGSSANPDTKIIQHNYKRERETSLPVTLDNVDLQPAYDGSKSLENSNQGFQASDISLLSNINDCSSNDREFVPTSHTKISIEPESRSQNVSYKNETQSHILPHQIAPICDNYSHAYETDIPDKNKNPLRKEYNDDLSHLSLENITHRALNEQCQHALKNNIKYFLCIEICERVKPWSFCSSSKEGTITDWNPRVLVFQHSSKNVINNWIKEIWKTIRGVRARPQHLVVIINPVGGRKAAVSVYNHQVAPLLQRAAIQATVHTTTHGGHGETLGAEAVVMSGVDGVVTVGGDGIVSEVANGMISATAGLCNLDLNDPQAALPDIGVRLGVIPGGSTDAYIHSLHGSRNVVTAAIHIIMGGRRRVDIAGLYSDGKLDRFVVAAVHMGYLGCLQETSLSLRHLGPARDVVSFLKEVAINRSHPCSMKLLVPSHLDTSPFDEPSCGATCTFCSNTFTKEHDAKGTWLTLEGEYCNINCALVSLECKYIKHGISPAAHTGDGSIDVVLLPKCSQLTLCRSLVKIATAKNYLSNPLLKVVRCSEVHFSGLSDNTPVNYDGELLYRNNFVLKVHRQGIEVFARGRERLCSR